MRNASLARSSPNNLAELRPLNGLARLRRLPVLGLILGALVACSTNEPPSVPAVEVQDHQKTVELTESKKMPAHETPTTSKPMQPGSDPHPLPQELMQKLVADVADKAGVSTNEVLLERAEKITFNDGSLGCPQPNLAYNQVLIEGYWVVFHVGSEEYDMRATDRGTFMRCQGSTKRAPIRYDDT